ncbi:disulfide bond formation protein B [Candidatus Dojkabacteria bacterium]|nr:disulfide bond formation protein B [Candidatus Dojkabacteria bacterium]
MDVHTSSELDNKNKGRVYTMDLCGFVKVLRQFLKRYGLNLIFIVGMLGVLVSLYFSEVVELPPCDLCWYQRILFYPIPLIALIGLFVRDSKAYYYIFTLSMIGLPISIYHHLLKVTDWFAKDTIFCGEYGACSELDWELWAGSGITIPLLCAVGFATMICLSFSALLFGKRHSDPNS